MVALVAVTPHGNEAHALPVRSHEPIDAIDHNPISAAMAIQKIALEAHG